MFVNYKVQMNRRNLILAVGVSLAVIFIALLGTQYFYFLRLNEIHKSQTKQLAHLALQKVADEIEVRELVRYLNKSLNSPVDSSSSLLSTLQKIKDPSNATSKWEIFNPDHIQEVKDKEVRSPIDNNALGDSLLKVFITKHEELDEYILRNMYQVYSYDSVPQLVNPRLLREHLRSELNAVGVTEPFSVVLCDAQDNKLYEYLQPGMIRRHWTSEEGIKQTLFVSKKNQNSYSPYILLYLDFQRSAYESMQVIIPGVVIAVIVLIIIIVTMVLLYRQLRFQAIKSNFVNNMTHELKTPISSIQLVVNQLQENPSIIENKTKRNYYLSTLEAEVLRLKALIDKVLQLSLYGGGKESLIPLSEISIDEMLLSALKIFTMRIASEAPGGKFELIHEANNTWIRGNETHMTNVLYNLLENAIKYRDKTKTLELFLRTYNDDDEKLVIEVEDNGLGIPESDTKLIFQQFYRVSDGLKHDIKGHGLGLAYVYTIIVKQFGGTITAKNKSTGGLIMRITLPTIKE